ncbi:MAG: hypothetical protein OXH50_05870 [Gemmatimonadetes bacterium]|nr:hypothetical protein [Gemmatimonadota bacterium]
MSDVSRLGGGYAESRPRPRPTAEAVLGSAAPGSAAARLAVIAGPPGSGKSSLAGALQRLLPGSFVVDKDWCSGPFILEIAGQTATRPEEAYGTDLYWERLRPIEYGTAVASSCANLVGARTVFLVGGWGPELGVEHLWTSLRSRIAPAKLVVIHLDPPEIEEWRTRMSARGSRTDSPWFESFCSALGGLPVWEGAVRLSGGGSRNEVVEQALAALAAGTER